MEFNSDIATKEDAMIWYYRESLKALLRVEMEQRNCELDNFDVIVKNTLNIKAKAAL